jgi:hypothetical protein
MTTTCPHCGYQHEATSGVDAETLPGNGDITICFRCGVLSIFAVSKRGKLRKPTKGEQRSLDKDPRISKLIEAWRATRYDQLTTAHVATSGMPSPPTVSGPRSPAIATRRS